MDKIKTIVIPLIIAILVIGIFFGICYLSDVNNYKKVVAGITIADIDLSKIPDGVYDGSYDVGYIAAKVKVAVTDGTIHSIDLIEHKNERGSAAEIITKTIVEEQKINVDTVSGATNSSRVIKKAVENALLQE
ncbi:MAG: FMN-binding protein [Acetobacterium woodii]|nr:FMN-binding protein [Acetobacterium woodii]